LEKAMANRLPCSAFTGTGGAARARSPTTGAPFPPGPNDRLKIAILSVDPTRRKTGGALLATASA
jgi:methylmalonyl-CoA mutase